MVKTKAYMHAGIAISIHLTKRGIFILHKLQINNANIIGAKQPPKYKILFAQIAISNVSETDTRYLPKLLIKTENHRKINCESTLLFLISTLNTRNIDTINAKR